MGLSMGLSKGLSKSDRASPDDSLWLPLPRLHEIALLCVPDADAARFSQVLAIFHAAFAKNLALAHSGCKRGNNGKTSLEKIYVFNDSSCKT